MERRGRTFFPVEHGHCSRNRGRGGLDPPLGPVDPPESRDCQNEHGCDQGHGQCQAGEPEPPQDERPAFDGLQGVMSAPVGGIRSEGLPPQHLGVVNAPSLRPDAREEVQGLGMARFFIEDQPDQALSFVKGPVTGEKRGPAHSQVMEKGFEMGRRSAIGLRTGGHGGAHALRSHDPPPFHAFMVVPNEARASSCLSSGRRFTNCRTAA